MTRSVAASCLDVRGTSPCLLAMHGSWDRTHKPPEDAFAGAASGGFFVAEGVR